MLTNQGRFTFQHIWWKGNLDAGRLAKGGVLWALFVIGFSFYCASYLVTCFPLRVLIKS